MASVPPPTMSYMARMEGDLPGALIPLNTVGNPQVDDFVRFKDPAGDPVIYALIVSRTWENVDNEDPDGTLVPVLLLREMADLHLVKQ